MSTSLRRVAVNGHALLSFPLRSTRTSLCQGRFLTSSNRPGSSDDTCRSNPKPPKPVDKGPSIASSVSKRFPVYRRFFNSIRRRNALPNPEQEPPRWRRSPSSLLFSYFSTFILLHFFMTHFYSIHGAWGQSMLPTLYLSGDWILISKWYRLGRNVKVGDIVCALSPIHPDETVVKRVLGMPGDLVCIWGGDENGQGGASWGRGEPRMVRVPKGHCWLAGDNLASSRDSRTYGPVPLALVLGKIIFRVWPLESIGYLDNTLKEVEEEHLPTA